VTTVKTILLIMFGEMMIVVYIIWNRWICCGRTQRGGPKV